MGLLRQALLALWIPFKWTMIASVAAMFILMLSHICQYKIVEELEATAWSNRLDQNPAIEKAVQRITLQSGRGDEEWQFLFELGKDNNSATNAQLRLIEQFPDNVPFNALTRITELEAQSFKRFSQNNAADQLVKYYGIQGNLEKQNEYRARWRESIFKWEILNLKTEQLCDALWPATVSKYLYCQ